MRAVSRSTAFCICPLTQPSSERLLDVGGDSSLRPFTLTTIGTMIVESTSHKAVTSWAKSSYSVRAFACKIICESQNYGGRPCTEKNRLAQREKFLIDVYRGCKGVFGSLQVESGFVYPFLLPRFFCLYRRPVLHLADIGPSVK
ncbi:hypothetical protein evm_004352 [Chilo suppressalis]|nr:hypothetical protein evm_004352 [Chilo suppressalis]